MASPIDSAGHSNPYQPTVSGSAPRAASPRPIEHVDELLGRTLNGRYRIESKLGEGGFGAVFEATQLQMNRRVALKVLHPHMTREPTMAARFRREAQAACALRDAHTVTTYDFDQSEEGLLYLVMELVRGRSLLAELSERGALAPQRAAFLLDQVASALAEAHSLGVVHRDIKPENILIEDRASQNDYVKVVDFGIAKLLEPDSGQTMAALTAAGQIIGTLEYMSPEQLKGERVDHRTDIYSVGVMLYQMLTNALPFDGAPASVITGHIERPPRPPRQLVALVPPELETLVLRCLAKAPAQRFANMSELRSALAPLLHDAPPASTPPPTRQDASLPQSGSGSGDIPRTAIRAQAAPAAAAHFPAKPGRSPAAAPAATPAGSGGGKALGTGAWVVIILAIVFALFFVAIGLSL